jgi:hypothetical protein
MCVPLARRVLTDTRRTRPNPSRRSATPPAPGLIIVPFFNPSLRRMPPAISVKNTKTLPAVGSFRSREGVSGL